MAWIFSKKTRFLISAPNQETGWLQDDYHTGLILCAIAPQHSPKISSKFTNIVTNLKSLSDLRKTADDSCRQRLG
jgi:hypothetical protein